MAPYAKLITRYTSFCLHEFLGIFQNEVIAKQSKKFTSKTNSSLLFSDFLLTLDRNLKRTENSYQHGLFMHLGIVLLAVVKLLESFVCFGL